MIPSPSSTPNTYYPTETVRCWASLNVLGAEVNPATLVLTVTDAAGNQTTYSSPTNFVSPVTSEVVVGLWYQDFNLPTIPAFGLWRYSWSAVGTQANQQGVSAPVTFLVNPLPV